MTDSPPDPVEAAAEEVRAHLVALRGGAPFLSPGDARLLLRWLDTEGRSVAEICLALERAAEARVKRRSRVPLRLSNAKRYLAKGASDPVMKHEPRGQAADAPPPAVHPLQTLIDALAEVPEIWASEMLASVLCLPVHDIDQLVRGALAAQRHALDTRWTELPSHQQSQRWEQARDAVLATLAGVDEATVERLAAERIREELRAETPLLTASSLMEHLKP